MQAFLGPDFNINEFPSSFNLSTTQTLRLTRLRTVENTLSVELDSGTDCESETIRKKNLLSFIYFRLHKLEEAVQLSNDLVELTQRRNVATLANRCFILWRNGDELEVRECRNCLKSLKNENDFHVLFTEAKAEQAYYYSRLGGTENRMQAETLFSQVVNEVPSNYLWKYGLGLVCRRATHGNIVSCSPKPVDLDASIKKAIQYLFEVADNGESWLKSMAYSQLINLRQVHTVGKIQKYDVLFRGLSVKDLVDRALDNDGDKIPSVLTQCGKALQWDNPDKSIKLLEKSVAIKPSSMSYHFLGKSYKRKAQWQRSKGCLSAGDPETDSVGQSIGGGRGSVGQSIGGGGGGGLPRLPLGSPGGEQNGFHDNKGMNNNSRGRSNFNQSFSRPRAAYETNRRFQRAGSISRLSGRADSFVGRSLSEHGIIASSRQPSLLEALEGSPGGTETETVGQSTEGGEGLPCLPSGSPGSPEKCTVGQSTEGGEGLSCLLLEFPGAIETDTVEKFIEKGEETLPYLPLRSPGDIETDTVEQSTEGGEGLPYLSLWSPGEESEWKLRSSKSSVARGLFMQHDSNTQICSPTNLRSDAYQAAESGLPPPEGPSDHLPSLIPSLATTPMDSLSPTNYVPIYYIYRGCHYYTYPGMHPQGLPDNFGYLENTYRDPNSLGFNFNDNQYGQTSPELRQQQHGYHDNKGMYHNSRGRNFTRSFSSPTSAYGTNKRFPRAGSNNRRRGRADSHFERSLSERVIMASSRKPRNQVYLNGDNEFVKKAVSCLKRAIKLSTDNVPANLDLGILLNETGNTIDALQQFNKVTNSKLASKSHRVSAISAFEQAGLCYLEMGKAGPRDNEDEEAGKRKLTQAVSLAAELALSMPELQGKTQELWTSFETLMNKIDQEQSSPTYIKNKVKLLELANNHGQIIDIFQNIPALTGNELSDKEMVTIAIKSYHNESKFEDALALQNIISLRPDVRESDWWKTSDLLDLRIKSLLQAAAGRLERATDTPIGLFRQVFQLLIGACFGAQDGDEDNPQAGGYVGDVLVVFNDDEEVDDGPHSSTVTSLGLQQVATSLFGLETERNLKGSSEYGDCRYETKLQEMRKYQVVIIVLGSETRCAKFNAVLENVFVNISRNEPTKQQRALIIDAGLGDGQIPLGLTHYERFKLTNMSGLRCADPSPDNERNGDQLSYIDILERGFHGDVNAVMELFCFMVGQKWPGS